MRSALVIVIVLYLPAYLHVAPEPINLKSHLREMVDRDALARWPSPQYVSREFTSYAWLKANGEAVYSSRPPACSANGLHSLRFTAGQPHH